MPWNKAQNALFRAAAHNPTIAKSSGIPMKKAKVLESEGVKTNALMKKAK